MPRIDVIAGAVLTALKSAGTAETERTWLGLTDPNGRWVTSFKARLVAEFRLQRMETLRHLRAINPRKSLNLRPGLSLTEIYEINRDRYKQRLVDAVKPDWVKAAAVGGSHGMNVAGIAYSFDLMLPEVQKQIDQWVFKLAGKVTDTTYEAIKAEMIAGMALGETVGPLSERIARVFETASTSRATMIAQTEATRALNGGQVMAWKQTPIIVAKEWWTLGDDLTCPFCAEMQESIVWMDQTFLALGGTLDVKRDDGKILQMKNNYAPVDFPPLHPHCRCSLMPITRDMANNRPMPPRTPVTRTSPVAPPARPTITIPTPTPSIPGIPIPPKLSAWVNTTDKKKLAEQFKTFGIKGLKSERYSTTEAFNVFNKIGVELTRVHERLPKLTKLLEPNTRKINKLYVTKAESVAREGFINGKVSVDTGGSNGYFWESKKIIAVNRIDESVVSKLNFGEWKSCSDGFRVIRHEYGHFVHTKTLTAKQRNDWREIYIKMGNKNVKKLVSQYAATNEGEFFAEAFGAFTHRDYKLGMMPKDIENFMVKNFIGKTPKPIATKPMTTAGKLTACVIGGAVKTWITPVLFYSILERPQACSDIVRVGGKYLVGGVELSDAALIARIENMKLPPAWTNVVIAKDPVAKIQAIGQDAVGRWQYRYSVEHMKKSAVKKFDRLKTFKTEMPNIRNGIETGIAAGDARAYVLKIEDKTAIRVGSDTDFKAKKKAYGLTTLQAEHVKIEGNRIIFDFTAKEGKAAHYEITDSGLAKWLSERKANLKPGDKLFPDVSASRLNDYIKELSGGKSFSAKDFRTYHGTRVAFEELSKYSGKTLTATEKKKVIKDTLEKASAFLHNTPIMARDSYIDPMVWDIIGGL